MVGCAIKPVFEAPDVVGCAVGGGFGACGTVGCAIAGVFGACGMAGRAIAGVFGASGRVGRAFGSVSVASAPVERGLDVGGGWYPPTMGYLERILDCRLDEITLDDLKRLISIPISEGLEIDFKSALYDYNKGEDFAADLVAFANTSGGTIVIGMAEADQRVTGLSFVEVSEKEKMRMVEWARSKTHPALEPTIVAVPGGTEAQGVYLVNVQRSHVRPHAVLKDASLRYYKRLVAGKNQPLSESEVADLYYKRFTLRRTQEERLDAVSDAARPVQGAAEGAWVVVSLAPVEPGELEISAERVHRLREWAQEACKPLRIGSMEPLPYLFLSMGRISISTRYREEDPARTLYCQLYTDGSASVAMEAGHFLNGDMDGVTLVQRAAECLRLAVRHAIENVGARGQAIARCHLWSLSPTLRLGRYVYESFAPYPPERTLPSLAAPRGHPRAIDLDAIIRDPTEWMIASRLLLADIFLAFGVPEVLYITAEGMLNSEYIEQQRLEGWMRRAKVSSAKHPITWS